MRDQDYVKAPPELLLDSDSDSHLHLKVVAMEKSETILSIRRKSSLPIVHLAIVPFAVDEILDMSNEGAPSIGDFVDAVGEKLPTIAAHFLRGLNFTDMDWCYELYPNHKDALFRSPTLYVLIGHKRLFEHSDFARRGVELLLEQDVLITSVHQHWRRIFLKRRRKT